MLKNEFKLIDGTFTGTEATELLSALFRDKQRFQMIKSLSHQEIFGKPDATAEKRLRELEETLADVLSNIKRCDEKAGFEIKATINIIPLNVIATI